MSTHDAPNDEQVEDCTSTTSFADHGLDDGETLIRETYYRLVDGGRTDFEPTEAFFNQLESAFVWSYFAATDERRVPSHVQAAIDDARARTAEAFNDRPDADLRTEVIPTFYQRVAGFHCIYRA